MELAPALLPARLDRRRRDPSEVLPKPVLPSAVGVDGQLAVGLLESLRVELEQPRPRLFELRLVDGEGDAP
ncbi:MAG TPA: hypothetical protein VHH55_03755 [Gaiellaceae bacterium]|nr:hypothetical protein [Gaiellaceae bacterium]